MNIAAARHYLARMNTQDATEQVRDWALAAALPQLGLTPAHLGTALYDFLPIRADYFEALGRFQVGPVREWSIDADTLVVLLPEREPRVWLYVGRSADRHRIVHGKVPRVIVLFQYRWQAEEQSLSVQLAERIAGARVMSAEFGLVHQTLDSPKALSRFLDANLDLVGVKQMNGGLTAYGRRFDQAMPKLVNSSDLATLRRAEADLNSGLRQRMHVMLRERYADFIDSKVDRLLEKMEEPNSSRYASLRAQAEKETPIEIFERKSIELATEINPPALGFSLDPRFNAGALAKTLGLALGPRQQEARQEVVAAINRSNELRNSAGAGVRSVPSGSGLDELMALLARAEQADPDAMLQAVAQRRRYLAPVVRDLARGDERAFLRLQSGLRGVGTVGSMSIGPGAAPLLIDEVQRLLGMNSHTVKRSGVFDRETAAAVAAFQREAELPVTFKVDKETWEKLTAHDLLNSVLLGDASRADAESVDDIDQLNDLFILLSRHYNYQCARYDGGLAGTEVGMTLFYTDLLMKLWSFDYPGSSVPQDGFVPQTRLKVSSAYADEMFGRLSATRSWLGLNADAVRSDTEGALWFAPEAVRIYNASPNELLPGKESKANYQSRAFSERWNAAYLQVADQEPQFHRLNQVMKWSAALSQVGGTRMAGLIQVSAPVPPTRFDRWMKSKEGLRTRLDLPKPIQTMRKEPTECLAILVSPVHQIAGRSGWMEGGVSLVRRKELEASLSAHAADARIAPALRRADLEAGRVAEAADRIIVSRRNGVVQTVEKSGIATNFQAPGGLDGSALRLQTDAHISVERRFAGASLEIMASSKGVSMGGVRLRNEGLETVLEVDPGALQLQSAAQVLELQDGSLLSRAEADGSWVRLNRRPAGPPGALRVRNDWAPDGVSVDPIGERDLTQLLHDYRSARLAWGAGSRATASLSKELSSEQTWAARVVGPGSRIEAGLDDEGRLVIPVDPDTLSDGLGRVRIAQDLMSERVAARLLKASETLDAGAMGLAVRGDAGVVVSAWRGEAIDAGMLEKVESILPVHGQVVHGVAVEEVRPGMRLDKEGILYVGKPAIDSDPAAVKGLVDAIERDQSLAMALADMNSFDAADLRLLPTIPPTRRSGYAALRNAKELPRSYGAFDLRFDHEGGLLIRIGNDVRSIDVSDASRQAVQHVDDVYKGLSNPTMPEFLDITRPLFDLLSKVTDELGVNSVVTLESPPPLAQLIWALHGGDARKAFHWDQPDINASLANVTARRPVDHAGLRVVSAVPFLDFALSNDAELRGAARDLISYGTVESVPLTSDRLLELMEDETVTELVLVAHQEHGRLLLADGPMSLTTLRLSLSIIAPEGKSVLQLVMPDAALAAAEFHGGHGFERIVVHDWSAGNQAPLSGLQQVRDYHALAMGDQAPLDVEDCERIDQHDVAERLRSLCVAQKAYPRGLVDALLDAPSLAASPGGSALSPDVFDRTIAKVLRRGAPAANAPAPDRDVVLGKMVKKSVQKLHELPRSEPIGARLRSMPMLKVEYRPGKAQNQRAWA